MRVLRVKKIRKNFEIKREDDLECKLSQYHLGDQRLAKVLNSEQRILMMWNDRRCKMTESLAKYLMKVRWQSVEQTLKKVVSVDRHTAIFSFYGGKEAIV